VERTRHFRRSAQQCVFMPSLEKKHVGRWVDHTERAIQSGKGCVENLSGETLREDYLEGISGADVFLDSLDRPRYSNLLSYSERISSGSAAAG
jgi:hypothetical protein